MEEVSKNVNKYLLKYLNDNTDDVLERKYINYLKIELDWYLYNYGDHISSSHLRNKKNTLKNYIASIVKNINTLCFNAPSKNLNSIKVLSSVYSMSQLSLNEIGLESYSSVIQPLGLKKILGDRKSISIVNKINKIISHKTFNDLNNKDLFFEIEELISILRKLFLKYDLRALLTYTGQYYSSKILLDIFRSIEKPSFIFSHGLPGIYSLDVDNNSDYLMVWGDKIKENYVNKGFNSDKIYVTGNPKYIKFDLTKKLRNSLEDVLVVPCSSILWHQHEWGDPILIDRNLIIIYLYQVQQVLLRLGVSHARVRPHPAIDKRWVSGFIDNNFYSLDNEELAESLSKTTLVIGAPSTTFLDSIIAGKNYIVYNPISVGGTDVPPFDGSDQDLVIATNEEDLFLMIKNKYTVNSKIVEGYIQPLDLSVLNKLIK